VRKFNRLSGKEIQGLSPEVLPVLMSHDFPGNIRELENIIEYATVVCKDSWIRIEHLPDYLRGEDISLKKGVSEDPGAQTLTWDDMEKTYLYETLRRNNWNRAATAAQMGIHTTTLWRKIKRLNLSIPKLDGRTKEH